MATASPTNSIFRKYRQVPHDSCSLIPITHLPLVLQRIDRRHRFCLLLISALLITTIFRWTFFILYQSPTSFPSPRSLPPPPHERNAQSQTSPSIQHLRSCNLLRAHGPDPYAAYGTLIWLYPINFLLYSEMNNFTLWIDFKNEYNDLCYDPAMGHENVWNYYMEPIDPQHAHCDVNTSTITVLSKRDVFPEMHYNLEWAIHGKFFSFFFV